MTDFGLQRRIAAFQDADDVAHGPPHSRRAIERAHRHVGERVATSARSHGRSRPTSSRDSVAYRARVEPGRGRGRRPESRNLRPAARAAIGGTDRAPADGSVSSTTRMAFAPFLRATSTFRIIVECIVFVCPSNALRESFSCGSCVKMSTALPAASIPA